ncbi:MULTISPECIES: site-specific DNA-methyltransferase [unclassified Aureimonas]
MPEGSIDCVVTSPPYFGLRDYGMLGQIGMEATPAEFVAALVQVFRQVRRVLKADGSLWLNIGDSYAGSWGAQSRGDDTPGTLEGGSMISARQIAAHPRGQSGTGSLKRTPGLKPKDLMMIPARVAIALQDDGWYLRQDIIWHKPNPMPESVRDRCTKAHEYVFLLTKSPRYFYDADAIAEGLAPASVGRLAQVGLASQAGSSRVPGKANGAMKAVAGGRKRGVPPRHASYESSDQSGLDDVGRGYRNKRSVWSISTQPFSDAHFATMAPELAETCILAGCPKGGTVLDPFGGAGTTALVALRHGRKAELIELNPDYAAMARRRIETEWRVSIPSVGSDFGPLFSESAA